MTWKFERLKANRFRDLILLVFYVFVKACLYKKGNTPPFTKQGSVNLIKFYFLLLVFVRVWSRITWIPIWAKMLHRSQGCYLGKSILMIFLGCKFSGEAGVWENHAGNWIVDDKCLFILLVLPHLFTFPAYYYKNNLRNNLLEKNKSFNFAGIGDSPTTG